MAGQNRFFRGGLHERSVIKADGRPAGTCVFISHKWEDKEVARLVAMELQALGLDYWLDVDDDDSMAAAREGNEAAMCNAVERGLQNSTCLLALISRRTRGSWWVPFEIGAARAYSRTLVFLVHKDVSDRPAWMTLGTVISDRLDLDSWANAIGAPTRLVEVRKAAISRDIDSVLPRVRILR
ncbi:toll/interleukin-1 receptor domain-containing protein [Sorangium sp. So ce426]|uniref:toll/interleukin-1 receptor domain-containing protein n=1 Tax=Sorangium sp. So ce426 TaxID=3133312 RepID=UPI003F5B03E1